MSRGMVCLTLGSKVLFSSTGINSTSITITNPGPAGDLAVLGWDLSKSMILEVGPFASHASSSDLSCHPITKAQH